MTSEEGLVKRFNELVREMYERAANYSGPSAWGILQNSQKQEFVFHMGKNIAELESLGIGEIKLEDAITKILEKVEEDVRKILANTQLTETEKKIKEKLDRMKANLRRDVRDSNLTSAPVSWQAVKELEYLGVSEHDLIKAKERVLEIME